MIAKKNELVRGYVYYSTYHLKQPPSITSNVKFMDNLSKIGSKTRG